jgi:hypothetical protein
VPAFKLALTAAMLDDNADALDYLDTSIKRGEPDTLGIRLEPALAGLRKRPALQRAGCRDGAVAGTRAVTRRPAARNSVNFSLGCGRIRSPRRV